MCKNCLYIFLLSTFLSGFFHQNFSFRLLFSAIFQLEFLFPFSSPPPFSSLTILSWILFSCQRVSISSFRRLSYLASLTRNSLLSAFIHLKLSSHHFLLLLYLPLIPCIPLCFPETLSHLFLFDYCSSLSFSTVFSFTSISLLCFSLLFSRQTFPFSLITDLPFFPLQFRSLNDLCLSLIWFLSSSFLFAVLPFAYSSLLLSSLPFYLLCLSFLCLSIIFMVSLSIPSSLCCLLLFPICALRRFPPQRPNSWK